MSVEKEVLQEVGSRGCELHSGLPATGSRELAGWADSEERERVFLLTSYGGPSIVHFIFNPVSSDMWITESLYRFWQIGRLARIFTVIKKLFFCIFISVLIGSSKKVS